ncbi:MAG: RNA polymerase sigma factor [Oscillospiraceae bacterium]|nr:RNA polymerase sigma factor [Oscillospiraceae bacterium]
MTVDQDNRNAIVDRYADMVWRIALARKQKEADAQDVFQEVFLRLFQKEREFREEEHRKAWLIRTTLVCCKGFRVAAFRHATLSLDEVSSTLSLPAEKLGVYEAMLRLPAKYRIPLQLYYIEGMSAEEAADAMGLRPGTFRVRMNRARKLLKEQLKGEGIDV